jgi:hypothetical protein
MKNRIILALLSLILLSCKKETFEHQNPKLEITSNCDSLSSSVPGTYEGYQYFYLSPWDPDSEKDSTWISFNITHIETTSNYIQDSLVCAFYGQGLINDTIYIQHVDGYTLNQQLFFNYSNQTVSYTTYMSIPIYKGSSSTTE